MNIISCLNKKLTQQWRRLQVYLFEPENLILNWSDYDKGVLLLYFGILSQVSVLKWCLYNYYFTEHTHWFNPEIFVIRVTCAIIVFFIFLILVLLKIKLQHHVWFRHTVAYCVPVAFGMTMIYGGYMIGIYSPATMAGTVNLILVGLVLYRFRIMLSIVIPIIIFILVICYMTLTHQLEYAPIFSHELKDGQIYDNHFWLGSMVELYLPILIISIGLFEILLLQWHRREKRIETLSQVDGLTNVYNRRFISHELTALTEMVDTLFAVVLLDMDHFKQINDQYGHEVGDIVLKRVGQILNENTRKQDIVGRFGGEEFILILKQQNLEQAVDVAERCRRAIERGTILLDSGQQLEISASFGVAIAKTGTSPEVVTRLADKALYLAKQRGRNQVCHFHELNLV